MTITLNNRRVEKSTINKAAAMATSKGENVAIVSAKMNQKETVIMATVSEFEASPNKDKMTLIAVVNSDGVMVD